MAKEKIMNFTRMSKLCFQPKSGLLDANEKIDGLSKSYKLMTYYGIIEPVSTGFYAVLPFGMRVLNKLITLVDKEMISLGAEKVMLPALTSTKLWKKTKRYESNKNEIFTVTDRHDKEYILNPTYEEAICDLISLRGHFPAKLLPLRLYQISSKWRDEMKSRQGLLRSREFVMKDLYTFDTTLADAQNTYNLVCESYNNIFKQIGIEYRKVIGDVGTIGGLFSHEYHYMSEIGEDVILQCPSCNYSMNQIASKTDKCLECKSEFHRYNSAEVGHTFLLNTKYSEPLNANYMNNNQVKPMIMGCFGLGLSRIITLMVEILSTSNEMRWPTKFAPYTVCIIPPKAGSKEESANVYVQQLHEILCERDIDVILDDRTQFTIGKRFINARAMGYPYVIIVGRTALKPVAHFEIHDINDSTCHELSLEQIGHYFDEKALSI